MSISIIQTPQSFEPLYTPVGIPIVVSSTSSTTVDFKYVFDTYVINPLTSVATKINRNKQIPLSDGTCIFSPAKILRGHVSNDVSPFGTGWTASNAIVKYKVLLGEEYPLNLNFSSVQSAATGYVQFNFLTNHSLSVGDTVYIYKSNSRVNNIYNGYHDIHQVTSTSAFTIAIAWSDPSEIETGFVTSVIRILSNPQVSGKTAFAGTRQYKERIFDFNQVYNLSGTTSKFLHTYTGVTYVDIAPDENYTLSMYCDSPLFNADSVIITTYTGTDNNYVIKGIYSTLIKNISSLYKRFDYKCGPANLATIKDENFLAPFTTDFIYDSSVTLYKISAFDSNTGTISDEVRFRIKSNCSEFEPKRICWVNKLTGWSYYTMNNKSVVAYEVNKFDYNKVMDYNYSVGDRGRTVYSQETDKQIMLSTGWISDYDSKFLTEEMIFSPCIYLLNDDQTKEGLIYLDKKIEHKTYLNNRLFTLTFTFGYVNKIVTQNG